MAGVRPASGGGYGATDGYEGKDEEPPPIYDPAHTDPYHVYRKQLAGASWDRGTIVTMAELGDLHRLFSKRMVYEDLTAVLSALVIILALALDMDMASWQDAHPGLTYYDTPFAQGIKWLTSLDCFLIVLLQTIRYKVIILKKSLRNVYPRNTGLFCPYEPTELKNYLLETFIAILHVPPGLDCYVKLGGDDVHVNIFNVIVLLRLYLVLRVMRNHSGFYGQHIHFIAGINGVDSLSIVFNFKMLLKYRPMALLTPLLCINTFATGAAMTILERTDPASKVNTIWDGVYLSLITMSTVGFGDMSPVTTLGRITCILGGVFGGILIMVMLVGIFVEGSETTDEEKFLINIVMKRKFKAALKDRAARTLQMMWLYKNTLHDLDPMDPASVRRVSNVNRAMHESIHALRVLRKQKPDMHTQKERDEQLSGALHETLRAMYGEGPFEEMTVPEVCISDQIENLNRRQQRMQANVAALLDVTYKLTRRK